MYKKTVKDRYLVFLILFAFCLSSATLGGFLLFGSELHFENGSVHIHHGNGDHGLGKADHSDADIILHLEYITMEPSSFIKACPVINHFLHTHFYPECHHYVSEILSVHHSGVNRFCSTGLYQLTSSYLI
jgi:hypothetical protein